MQEWFEGRREVPLREFGGNDRRHRAVMACLIIWTTGCSHERGAGRRAQDDTPTLGTDFSSVPQGRTIPPAGLGVDLVNFVSEAGRGGSPPTTSESDRR
jgi:hypothetical protein